MSRNSPLLRAEKTVVDKAGTVYIKAMPRKPIAPRLRPIAQLRPALALLLCSTLVCHCSSAAPERPLAPSEQMPTAGISLSVPLPKALVIVVDRVVATLEVPGLQTIVKELTVTPLGPATGIIGALPPSTGLTITLNGYDLDGELLFNGQRRGLAITAGDTTRVTIELILVQEIDLEEPEPADTPVTEPGEQPADDPAAVTATSE